ncbi:MAG: asparagine synthase (glutamine-hydrolyzing) [Cyanobacteria bacterium P01_H01_bin.121]
MCGIAGFWNPQQSDSASSLNQQIHHMVDRLQHRGPDSSGVWCDEHAGIALGHRRLAIVDLTPTGHQPMHSASDRYVITFNGEIYNFKNLAQTLSQLGHRFRGSSDTEVMLAAFEQWGLQAAVAKFVGMFAFTVWDRAERVLWLGRDRLGEKPLYYGWQQQTFLFGSELSALRAQPAFRATINRGAIALLMRHNYIPSPYSIYDGIAKLPPGNLLKLEANRTQTLIPYWSLATAVQTGLQEPFRGSPAAAIDRLEQLLRHTVHQQMIADVPLGAFLSGGIDSSTIVALMQAQSTQPVKTFSIGFHEAGYDEAPYAKAIAQHLGTDHTELYVSPREAQAVIPLLPQLYSEPFSDSSQIPTYLVSKLTRSQVTVSLSGDAGDELFCGYNRYLFGRKLWRRLAWLPKPLRQTLAKRMQGIPVTTWNQIYRTAEPLLPKSLQARLPGDKVHKLANVLGIQAPELIYQNLVAHWTDSCQLVLGADSLDTPLTRPEHWGLTPSFVQQMMYLDTITYLPNDILVKVDRAAMGVSLETRIPFLDHRVVEFAWQLPLALKLAKGQSKWVLRQVLERYVPAQFIDRPKMGFGIPLDQWLRGALRDWCESLLSETRLQQEGFFQPAMIRQKWQEHLAGERNWQYHLWDVLMFQAWLEQHYQT